MGGSSFAKAQVVEKPESPVGNRVHPTAILGPFVEMGDDNTIGPYCTIMNGTRIGNGNYFEAHCSVGSPAEKHGFMRTDDPVRVTQRVVIGDRNIIREFTTINAGTKGNTRMGNDCVMLRGSHLSHDSILEDKVTVSCNVLIGGESHIMQGANLGLGCILHQYSVVGSWAMVGMGAVCTKSLVIFPCETYAGNPARWLKRNRVGMDRFNVTNALRQSELDRHDSLRAGLRKP